MSSELLKDNAKHFNGLTPAEDERLALLIEEMGEALQAIGKIQRHGYRSFNPMLPRDKQITNTQMLERELGDIQAALSLMRNAGDVSSSRILEAMEAKLAKLPEWMHHQ